MARFWSAAETSVSGDKEKKDDREDDHASIRERANFVNTHASNASTAAARFEE